MYYGFQGYYAVHACDYHGHKMDNNQYAHLDSNEVSSNYQLNCDRQPTEYERSPVMDCVEKRI